MPLGECSWPFERASLGLFIAQDPHRNLVGKGRHQKQSHVFVAPAQAELLMLLFLHPLT